MEDDEIGDGLKVVSLSSDGSLDTNDSFNSHHHHPLNHQEAIGGLVGLGSSNAHGGSQSQLLSPNDNFNGSINTNISQNNNNLNPQQRRRRKLPEIPKNKKCKSMRWFSCSFKYFYF